MAGAGLRPLKGAGSGVISSTLKGWSSWIGMFSPLKGWLKNWISYAHARFN